MPAISWCNSCSDLYRRALISPSLYKKGQIVTPFLQDYQDSMKNPYSVQHPCITFLNNSYSTSKYKKEIDWAGLWTTRMYWDRYLVCLSFLPSVVSRLRLDRDSLRQWMIFVLSSPFRFLRALISTAFESTHTREHLFPVNNVVMRLPVLCHSPLPGFSYYWHVIYIIKVYKEHRCRSYTEYPRSGHFGLK